MYIYKITNNINGKWYIGKHNGSNPDYMGSGKLLKLAYNKYGVENFSKVILESCDTEETLSIREQFWINSTKATSDPTSYNLAEGGSGGDLSKFHNYSLQNFSSYNMSGPRKWFAALSDTEKSEWFAKQGTSRSKGWFVSRIDDPRETYVQNIAKWCDEHCVDKSMPSSLNNPNSRLYQKQTKGWRIRRSDMPALPPYENRRFESTINQCKGRTWVVENGKRIWCDK